jgi:hypothetical protein
MGGRLFSPLNLTATLEGWDHRTLAAAAVSSWLGRKLGTNLAQGTADNQPVKGASGVTFDGTDDILSVAFGSVLNTRTTLRCVISLVDTSTTVKSVVEYSVNPNTQTGGLGFLVNDGADKIETICFNATSSITSIASQPLTTVKVVSFGIDYANTTPNRVFRVNGSVATPTNTNTITAGAFGNHSLFVGARSGGLLPWAGSIRQLWFLSGVAQDADLDAVERYCGTEAGLSW